MDIYIKDYTTAPGGRFEQEGDYSGEEFRKHYLEPLFSDENKEPISIYLDGTEGYPSSFLDEAFGGLARKLGTKKLLDRITFISEDQILKNEITGYIKNA